MALPPTEDVQLADVLRRWHGGLALQESDEYDAHVSEHKRING